MPSLAARNISMQAVTVTSSTAEETTTQITHAATAMTTLSNNSSLDAATNSITTTTTTNNVNVVSGTCTFPSNNFANTIASKQTEVYQQQQQPQQQYQKLNNYYYPPPAVGYASSSSSTATATGLATFNGNSNLENVANGTNVNTNTSGSNSNNNNSNINLNYSNGNLSIPTLTNKMNTPTSSSSPVVGKTTDATSSSSNSILSVGSIVGIAPVPASGFNKKQQQLHASREDVASLGGGGSSSHLNSQITSTNANSNGSNNNNNNNNSNHQHQPQPQIQYQHHQHLHYHHDPPRVFSGIAGTTANGGGNSSSNNSTSSQHNLNSILKGSKENLLQNNYCNGSIGGSTTGSETGGIGPGSGNLPEHDDPGDGLGPLPGKWETAYTERGELYFIDHNTGTSHWLDPRLSKFQKKSLEECTEGELPYGWEKIEDSLYGTYYIDHVNRKTQYENPVLEAKRRAAEQSQKQMHQLPQTQQQRPQTPSSSSVLNGTGANIALSSVSSASTLSTVDISQRAMQPPPPMPQQMEQNDNKPMLPYKFTRNPAEMQGERITATLLKSARGLGITIVGGDDGVEEFLQIKSIVPNGPAWLDGQLQMGDVLVYVNDTCVLGFTHHEMVNVFQSIRPGDTVTLEVCRGYSLPFDPNDPSNEVVTTIAVDGISNEPDKQRRMLMDLNMDGNYNFLDISGASNNGHKHNLGTTSAIDNSGFILMKKPEVHTFSIIKGAMGFGFTIADSSYGQKVKKILDRSCCNQLQEGDILLEINDNVVRNKSHLDVVQILKDCSKTEPTLVKIQRPVNNATNTTSPNGAQSLGGSNNVTKLRKNFLGATTGIGNNALFRSKTPTADLYSTMQKEILPIRPKTPLVDTRRARVKTPNMELNEDNEVAAVNTSAEESLERSLAESKTQLNEGSKSQNSLSELDAIPFMDPYPKMVSSLSERLAGVSIQNDGLQHATHSAATGYLRTTASGVPNYENQSDYVSAGSGNYSSIYGLAQMPPTMSPLSGLYGPHGGSTGGGAVAPPPLGLMAPSGTNYHHHHESCFCYECQDYRNNHLRPPPPHHVLPQQPPTHHHHQQQQQPSPRNFYPAYHSTQHSHSQYSPASSASLQAAHIQNERMQKRVNELLNDRRRVGFSPLDHHHNAGILPQSTASYSPSSQQQQQQQHLSHHHHHQQQQPLQHQQHSPVVPGSVANWPSQTPVYNVLSPNNGGLMLNGFPESSDILDGSGEQFVLSEVTLQRQALGFGFRIVGGTEEGSQVTVGHIVPGGAADNDHRITTGDEILSIDGINVVNSSHHKVVSLMGEAALRGQVTMILRRNSRTGLQQQLQTPPTASHSTLPPTHPMIIPTQSIYSPPNIHTLGAAMADSGILLQHPPPLQPLLRNNPARYPYDVIVSRNDNEGFGFVIISSSNQYYGSTIGKLISGSPADRCGELKVGDRIVAVNRIDIAGMSHGDVVNLIKESGLHVRLTIGCPKEGAIINAAPTLPAGSGTAAGLLINSAQASPGQLSHTTLANNLQNNTDNTTSYFERPLLSGGSNAGSAASSLTHPSAQQSPQPLPAPPQL